jgi:hypothetical protein
MIVSILSLLVAVGTIATLFSARNAGQAGSSQVSSASYLETGDSGPPIEIDAAMIGFREVMRIPLDLKKVTALAVDADDRIYVAGDKEFCRYSPQGALENRIPLSYEPMCLTVGNRQHIMPGRIYVGFSDHVEVFDANGIEVKIWQGLGEQARFTSIACSEHYIFIADAGQNVVQRFDWEGKLLESFGESQPPHFSPAINGVRASFDLAFDLDDLVYVVNRRDHRIEGYSDQGHLERHWGNASPAVEDFAGTNNPVHLAITSSDHFVTAEEDPLRIKLYSRFGKFERVVCGSDGVGSVAGLAADSRNRILVLDGKSRCVRVFEEKPASAEKKPQ